MLSSTCSRLSGHATLTADSAGRSSRCSKHDSHDRGSQYTSLRFRERLAEAGIAASVGSVGDSFHNALAETINGLYKTELIKPGKPWRTVEQVEIATAEWVDWFNNRHLYEYCGDIPPSQLEAAYYAHHRAQPTAALTRQYVSGLVGVVHNDSGMWRATSVRQMRASRERRHAGGPRQGQTSCRSPGEFEPLQLRAPTVPRRVTSLRP